MSFHSSKLRSRSLTPALAAVLLQIGTAAAADHTGTVVQPDSQRSAGLVRPTGDALSRPGPYCSASQPGCSRPRSPP